MPNCNHEEADTRILIHLKDAILKGAKSKSVMIRTVDTDVIVLLIGKFGELQTAYGHIEIWVSFGVGRNHQMYHINHLFNLLGAEKAKALPVFHAYTILGATLHRHLQEKVNTRFFNLLRLK